MTHYLDSGAREFRGADLAMRVGTWCGDWAKTNEATTIAGRVDCPRCRAAMDGRKPGATPPSSPIDGAIREQVEGAIGFLPAGGVFDFTLDDHTFAIVNLRSRAEYLIACVTCAKLIDRSARGRRVFHAAHNHTKEPIA